MNYQELQLDGLVGPTHNYGGLSWGNVAAEHNALSVSNPREAALQGLRKMKFVADLGVAQAVMPPQPRPVLQLLRDLGFGGNEAKMLEDAHRTAPELLAACYSASAMWAANAATVAPSPDTADGKVHFTPANLISKLHRSLEAPLTTQRLRQIFADPKHFEVHEPLPATDRFSDEGAANHMRIASAHGKPGLHVFVYGKGPKATQATRIFPARQDEQVAGAIAHRHRLSDWIALQQTPEAIDAGVFHNDVIAMNNEQLLVYHERAFVNPEAIDDAFDAHLSQTPTACRVVIRETDLALQEVVKTYLFNSQLLSTPSGLVLVAPIECEASKPVARIVAQLVERNDTPLKAVHYLDVRESMRNGGGPACLRLRVVLSDAELAAMHQGARLSEKVYFSLTESITSRYRDRLTLDDLRDPALMKESAEALEAIEECLELRGLE